VQRITGPTVVRNNLLDSTRWQYVAERNGDVVIATWAKAGTTWVQQIVAQLVLGSQDTPSLNQISPWVEHRFVPLRAMCEALEAQTHTRFMKTHLPATALCLKPGTRYLFVGRDGRDVLWSWYNHHRNLNERFYEIVSSDPGSSAPYMAAPTADVREYFLKWLHEDGYPLWPFWAHVRSWWALRNLPNVMLLHFDDLKQDLAGSIARIAAFIGVHISPADSAHVASRCTFAYMKARASELLPEQGRIMVGGAESFINRGEGGGWRDVLRPKDVQAYTTRMHAELEPECSMWLSRPYHGE
jgi:aryl sulfotransferase